jgi:hypothetical protein
MPKKIMDYSKCKIYKLASKDLNVTQIYVGHNTNWSNRKHNHKIDCNNLNSKNYNIPVYQFIRNNGGWDNWDMILVEDFPCENVLQARQRERYWIETLNASLNIRLPGRTEEEYNKWYNDTHKEEHKQYYREHREERLEYLRQYNVDNYDELKQKKKEYYNKNIELIKKKNSQMELCECGIEISHSNLGRHKKSQKHLKLMEEKLMK